MWLKIKVKNLIYFAPTENIAQEIDSNQTQLDRHLNESKLNQNGTTELHGEQAMFDQILSQLVSLSHRLKIDINTEKTKHVFIQNKETVKDEQAMFEILIQAWKDDIEQQSKDTASHTVEAKEQLNIIEQENQEFQSTLKDMNKRLNTIRQETEISTPVVYKDKTELEEALKVSVERMTNNKMDGFDILCQEIADINTQLYQDIQKINQIFNSHILWQMDFKKKMCKCFDTQYDPYYVTMLRRHMHISTEECLDSYLLACHSLARYYATPFDWYLGSK